MCLLTMHATLGGNMLAESNEELLVGEDGIEEESKRGNLPSPDEYEAML